MPFLSTSSSCNISAGLANQSDGIGRSAWHVSEDAIRIAVLDLVDSDRCRHGTKTNLEDQ